MEGCGASPVENNRVLKATKHVPGGYKQSCAIQRLCPSGMSEQTNNNMMWEVQLPPSQSFVISTSSERLLLANPDSPQTINLLGYGSDESIPAFDRSKLLWTAHASLQPWDYPILPSHTGYIWVAGANVATVIFEDVPDAVPDQSSTLSLLTAALLGTGGIARFRRFSFRSRSA